MDLRCPVIPRHPQTLFGNARLRNSVSRLGRDSKLSFEKARSQTEFEGVSVLVWAKRMGLQWLSFFCHKETNTAGGPKDGQTCQGGHDLGGAGEAGLAFVEGG